MDINLEIAKQILANLQQKYTSYSSKIHPHALVEFNVTPMFIITILINNGKIEFRISLSDNLIIDLADPQCFEVLERQIAKYLDGHLKVNDSDQTATNGGLAQLGERLDGIQEVTGSTPVSSTSIL